MGKKKTTEDFKKEVYNLVKDEYIVLTEYLGYNKKITLKHNIDSCLREYETEPRYFTKGGGRCNACSKFGKKDNQAFKDKIKELTGDEYIVLGEYISSKKHVLIRHNIPECMREYEVVPENFYRGSRCASCRSKKIGKETAKRKTQEQFNQEVWQATEDEYTFLEEYSNNATKIKVRHNVCNGIYSVRPNHFLSGGNRCPYCSPKAKWSNEKFTEKIKELVQDEYIFIDEYNGYDTKIRVRHNSCNSIYEVIPSDFIRGRRCPQCSRQTSQLEKELLEYIKTLLPNENIIENDRKLLNGKEIDIYIPNKNIGFEFDGLYWHTTEYIEKDYHLNKTLKLQSNNIKLIHIFEDEWKDKKDLIKTKLSHILGVNAQKRIFSRKCEVKKIEISSDKTKFLNENHIQGADRANFAYGLYFENELVALMSFIKPRINMGRKNSKEGEYELSRYATKYNVIGGFGKLLKHIIKNEEIKEIYTYADLRWTNPDNNVYLKNGFEYVSTSSPNYWYMINNKRESRFSFQKGKLKEKFPETYSDNKTEEEIMKELGYYRIYDCGNLKYNLIIK